jgi:hypothetical protein
MTDLIDVLQAAVASRADVSEQRRVIVLVLRGLGHDDPYDCERVIWDGKACARYTWRDTPVGDLVLVAGLVLRAEEMQEGSPGHFTRRKVASRPVPQLETLEVPLDRRAEVAAWAQIAVRAFAT